MGLQHYHLGCYFTLFIFYIFSKAKLKSHLISCKEKKAGVGDFFVGRIVGI